MTASPTPSEYADRLIALFGGREALRAALETSHNEVASRWQQDAVLIGRLLRAHLFVEHYLTEYLAKLNPNLGDIEVARLSFAQKLALADRANSPESYLIPGIRHLNKVRNRMAHTLKATVTLEDRNVLLGVTLFKALREQLHAPERPSEDPVDVLEDFARHAGGSLAAAVSPNAEFFRRAWDLSQDEGRPPNTSLERTREG